MTMRRLLRIATLGAGALVAGCGGRTLIDLDERGDASRAEPYLDAEILRDDGLAPVSAPDAKGALDASGTDAASQVDARDAGRWVEAPTFCAPAGALDSLDVWSDDRGVYVLTSQYLADEVVQFDSGSGWTPVYRAPTRSSLMRLTGFVDGPLVLYGEATCGIRFLSAGAAQCSAGASFAQSVHTVRPDLAYAVQNDRVLWYQGGLWTQLGDPLQPAGQVQGQSVWSNGDASVVAATQGRVFVASGTSTFVAQPKVPPNDFRSAWGFATDDLWVGDSAGNLVHGDGSAWTVAWTDPACGGRPIRGMWGHRGSLYFYTDSSVGVRDASGVRTIFDEGCNAPDVVTGLWGNSPSEVFFVVRRGGPVSPACGVASVFLFDGLAARPL